MEPQLVRLFEEQNGVATSGQILSHMTRHAFESAVDCGALERVWYGIYCRGEPTEHLLLHGLDLACGRKVPLCLASAAAVHGFDTEGSADLHILNPPGCQLRSADGLVVHRRDDAPLTSVDGRYVTAPAWTAIEVARALRRPRALATLDAALRSATCTRTDLWRAALEQAGRRGIVAVRNLIALADGRAESPMESEARLVMIDGGLPVPELQYEVIDGNGQVRRLDFAWPQDKVAVEYDSLDWHGNPDALRDDRRRTAALMDVGWIVISIVFDDVRHRDGEMVARINRQLSHARAA
ncbi:type IV toxin-antitoxin system AbiEi family antitoxin domain-containing protein [Mycolicibacterium neworleansense]|uniref:type IV toxin-antitoxin system AbiEi family antitoxin domain-containing protein n=1 Tax=Mycolicibacterium neworleansense TaxID=146018 RepID=UPI000B80786D|nr:type IV toxin-antitoxin system AbiEi family antitoxin domain-containing protein [Mycolicibacterium neworleansense]MCV7364953.1 type IV toxin-antitoxin system AbiEi family antitoxin domain-containing protein [Mycolicibacterium neworleansense]